MQEISDKAGRFFDGYAGDFDDIYDTQAARGVRGWLNRGLRASMAIRFRRTFSTLTPMQDHSVLDIGCGSGRYMVACLQLGASRVVGIDVSETMLTLAKATVDGLPDSVGRTELVCGDFLSHEFTEQYDYGMIMGVMDYIADPATFLRRVKATITGKAVFSFPVAGTILTWQRKLRYRLRGCPLYVYRFDQLEHLFSTSGFASYSVDRIHRDYFVAVEL